MSPIRLITGAALAGLLCCTPARAEDFSFDDVTIAAPLGTYSAKRIEISGSPLTRDAVQKLLSPATPGSGAEKFAQIDAARIFIPELTSRSQAQDYEQTTVYRDVAFTKVAKGVAETIDVAGAEITARRAGVANRGRLGAIHAEGVDFPALLRIAIASRMDSAEAKKVTTRRMTIAHTEIEIDGGGKLTVGAIEDLDRRVGWEGLTAQDIGKDTVGLDHFVDADLETLEGVIERYLADGERHQIRIRQR